MTKWGGIDKNVQEFLKSRGFEASKMPKWAKAIVGEYQTENRNGEIVTRQKMGIGVEFDSGGADIHYLKPIKLIDGKTLKTMSFGNKDITTIEPENPQNDSKTYAIFESKNDAIAAYHQVEELKNQTIIIANGAGNANKIVDILKQQNDQKEVIFYNQNDPAGVKFVKDIAEKSELKEFKIVEYKDKEIKKDINDLHKNGVKIEERFTVADTEKLKKMEEEMLPKEPKKERPTIEELEQQLKELQRLQREKQAQKEAEMEQKNEQKTKVFEMNFEPKKAQEEEKSVEKGAQKSLF